MQLLMQLELFIFSIALKSVVVTPKFLCLKCRQQDPISRISIPVMEFRNLYLNNFPSDCSYVLHLLPSSELTICQDTINTRFQQHRRRLYTWTSPDGQHRNQIDYILCNQRWRSSIQSAKTRAGADCGSDHELLIAKFRLN